MSIPSEEHPVVERRWFRQKSVGMIRRLVVLLLGAGLVVFIFVWFGREVEVGGGLIIEADPDTRIYIGEKLLGTTQVTLAWAELIGDGRHKPLAIELSSPASSVTAEMLSGPGATVLEIQEARYGGWSTVSASPFGYLIRRADGQLDEVVAIIINWQPVMHRLPVMETLRPRRYLLPVRLRNGSGKITVFVNPRGSGSPTEFLKDRVNKMKWSWTFSPGSPPNQFAKEIKTKGLWEPAGAE